MHCLSCTVHLQLVLPGEQVPRTSHMVLSMACMDMPEFREYSCSVGNSVYPNTTMVPVKSIALLASNFEVTRRAEHVQRAASLAAVTEFDIATDIAVMPVSAH